MNDLISRLSEIRSIYNCFDEYEEPYYRALSEAIQLVSAQLERKRGKWKHGVCQTCFFDWSEVAPLANVPNFCPNCGARMVTGDD